MQERPAEEIIMEQFFNDPKALVALQQSLFAPFLNSFAAQLLKEGYVRESIRVQIKLVCDFGFWLKRVRVPLYEVAPEHAHRYLRYRKRKGATGRSDSAALKRLLRLLHDRGVIAEVEHIHSPVDQAVEEFVSHLCKERGLAAATIVNYRTVVQQFLSKQFGSETVNLSCISPTDIHHFVRMYAAAHSPRMHVVGTALRSFLRYLHYRGYVSADLATAVPPAARWSLAAIPKAIPREQVELVLASCDRETAVGQRDFAILQLLARLGVRGGEIVSLRLRDIDWEAGRITVHGKGGRELHLPLVSNVGEALAEYLSRGRPPSDDKHVFLRSRAPVAGLRGPSAVSNIVLRALLRAGIEAPRKGAHQFRHGLATELLRQGASLSEIGEVLGHRSPNATAVYAKVDLSSLRALAMPWPGGAQ